jgi:hypothetical protein
MTNRTVAILLQLFVIAGWPNAAAAQTKAPPVSFYEYEWVDLGDCRKPKVKAPRLPREDYEEYNFQRRFLSLAPGRTCFIMDTFIERLGGSSSPGMRAIGTRAYRLERGKWVSTGFAFSFFTYAIRRRQDGRIFYVEALLEHDLMDGSLGRHWSPEVLTSSSAEESPSFEGEMYSISRVDDSRAPVLQGMAVVLSQRLRSMPKEPASEEDRERERIRIRKLLGTAWETLPPESRVKVDAEGMPL